ncbi:hypothetical protein PROFUN_13560 [Planoprotostelium fungivorum]|uniref:Protein kinase domain-containing protein n=1 Tax=Planoprotostelium fungivorum TaxID=1890364 RepID=A0A2P6N3F2_9EUKA|nr:hypothetical protein PROFUN_13560 [Planoprotostelium fungivorum]
MKTGETKDAAEPGYMFHPIKYSIPSGISKDPKATPKEVLNHLRDEPDHCHSSIVDPTLERAFHQFMSIDQVSPTQEDCQDAFDLMIAVSQQWKEEKKLREEIQQWASESSLGWTLTTRKGQGLILLLVDLNMCHCPSSRPTNKGIELEGRKLVSQVLTIAHNSSCGHREVKTTSGGEAFLQNCGYYYQFYIESTTKKSYGRSACPCLLISFTQQEMVIFGAVFTDDGPIIDPYYSINLLYVPNDNLCTELDGQETPLTYQHRIGKSLVFRAKLGITEEDVVVKVTCAYNTEAHMSCTPFSPQIRAVIKQLFGWTYVIMDYVAGVTPTEVPEEKRAVVKESVNKAINGMHERGFVHGDLRLCNILVRQQDCFVYIIDFDYSGKEGEAKYPYFLNTKDIRWPDGVASGKVITQQHDKDMISKIFSEYLAVSSSLLRGSKHQRNRNTSLGANVHDNKPFGSTPLIILAQKGYQEMTDMLLCHGALSTVQHLHRLSHTLLKPHSWS